jgi:hypothetical protein
MKRTKTFKKFHDWHNRDIHLKLGYDENSDPNAWHQTLTINLDNIPALDSNTAQWLNGLRIELKKYHAEWNEAELMYRFIGPVVRQVNFSGDHYNYFLQRTIRAKVQEWEVHGVVDWLVAAGDYEPHTPYFFIHEYKQISGNQAEPLGQLLIAMIAAQQLNAKDHPLYGCYIIGNFWRFVWLSDTTYALSQGYDATDEHELFTIYQVLQAIHAHIQQLCGPLNNNYGMFTQKI